MQAEKQFKPVPLDNTAALEGALKRDKLQVVELCEQWCGPTKALPTFWENLALEHGGQLPLDYSSASYEACHDAAALANHPSTCQPKFLVFKNGKQVACIEGVDPPGLLAAINKQLAASNGSAMHRADTDSEEEE